MKIKTLLKKQTMNILNKQDTTQLREKDSNILHFFFLLIKDDNVETFNKIFQLSVFTINLGFKFSQLRAIFQISFLFVVFTFLCLII